jgi:hypothetical protein
MGTLNYKVINNFLDKEFFYRLQNLLFSKDTPWFFQNNMTSTKKDNYYFGHIFYGNFLPQSFYFNDFIIPIVEKLNAKSLINIRANLTLKQEKVFQSDFHMDRPFKCNTAILYMNTCNGYTILDDIKINCEENKIVIFDSQIKHAAVSQTDTERRMVINFNYF